jgi:tetratricopeptide (TPR) repeat protein
MKKALVLAFMTAVPSMAMAQNPPTGMTPAQARKAEAYFHYSMARVLDQSEEFDESIKEYRKSIDINPNDSAVYTSMAQTYLKQRNREEAMRAAQRAVELDRNNIGAHLILKDLHVAAVINLQSGRQPNQQQLQESYDNAVHELEEILRIDPSKREEYLQLGYIYRLSGNADKAREIYRKFLGTEPGSEEGVMALADLSMDNDRNAEAIDILNEFLNSQPNSPRALEMLGDAHSNLGNSGPAADAYKRAAALSNDEDLRDKLANAYYQDNRLADAAKVYEEILSEDQGSLQILQRLGQIYRRQMKYTEARDMLTRAQRRSLGNSSLSVRFDLALVDRDEGKFEESIRSFEALLRDTEKNAYTQAEKRSRALFYTQIGAVNSLMTRFDRAIEAFTNVRALSDFAETPRVDMTIADTYREARNLDRAQEVLESALKNFPDNRELQVSYADLLAARGRVDEGLQVLTKLAGGKELELDLVGAFVNVYERAKRYAEAQKIIDSVAARYSDNMQLHFMQGALYEQQDKAAEAEASFRKALALDANNPSVLNYLGYMLADRGMKLDEAVAMIQKAVDADPISGAFLDSLGWAFFKLDRLDLAERYLTRAVAFAATNATMYDHLGDVFYKTQRYAEAQAAWTKGLPYADDSDEAARMRQKLEEVRSRTGR